MSIKSGEGSVRYYPFDTSDPTGPCRTHKQLIRDAKSAVSQGSQVMLVCTVTVTCSCEFLFVLIGQWCEGSHLDEYDTEV